MRCQDMTQPIRCAACTRFLSDPRPNQRFCDKRCRDRAAWRRAHDQPEQDPSQVRADLARLVKADRQLTSKERTIARLRSRHQIDRDRTRAAEVAAAAADRRAERAIESMGRDQHALSRDNAELADALRKARQDLQTQKRHSAQLHEVIATFRADAERCEIAEQQVPTQTIRRQWEALAMRIARQASGNGLPLAGIDQEVVSTWQRLRHSPRTPQKQSSPRRRNR